MCTGERGRRELSEFDVHVGLVVEIAVRDGVRDEAPWLASPAIQVGGGERRPCVVQISREEVSACRGAKDWAPSTCSLRVPRARTIGKAAYAVGECCRPDVGLRRIQPHASTSSSTRSFLLLTTNINDP